MELNINIQGTAPSKQDIEDYRESLNKGIDSAHETIRYRKWIVFVLAAVLGVALFGLNTYAMFSLDIQLTTALLTTVLVVAAGVIALREGQQHYLASMPLAFFITALFISGVLSGLEHLGISHQMHSGQFNLVSVSIMFLSFLVCLFSFALIQYFIIEPLDTVEEHKRALRQLIEINSAVDTQESQNLADWSEHYQLVARYLERIEDRTPIRMEYLVLRSYTLQEEWRKKKEDKFMENAKAFAKEGHLEQAYQRSFM